MSSCLLKFDWATPEYLESLLVEGGGVNMLIFRTPPLKGLRAHVKGPYF